LFCVIANNNQSLGFILFQSKNAGNAIKKEGGDSPEKDQLLRRILLWFPG